MSLSNINHLIREIRDTLTTQFQAADAWFDAPENLRGFRPPRGSWTIDEILEHITLTNHFLLILIRKGGLKSMQLLEKHDLKEAAGHYVFQREKLEEVGTLGTFIWTRPEHMEPQGAPGADVRVRLKEQLQECLDWLDQLGQGAGILYKTTMTVNELGKIDVYEYLYFLAMHIRRHLMQMEENTRFFEATTGLANEMG
ncbi:MAG TPA: DinB family protein [Saprospirales bacterium]|nr:DinB family protein [Saprospirales bacterium]